MRVACRYLPGVLLLAGLAAMAQVHAHLCKVNCTLLLEPVCALDGRSYMNDCIAGCAGQKVNHTGYCTGRSTWKFFESIPEAASIARQAPPYVTSDVMQKFQADGYVYLGRVALAQYVPNQEEVKQQVVAPVVEDAAATSGYVEVLRATPPGDFYSARLPYKPSPIFNYPPYNPQAKAASVPRQPVAAAATATDKAASGSILTANATSQARKLQTVLGNTDDRVLCKRMVWPFAPVAQLTVEDSSGELVCSGSLVGPDRLLTAAHCVWSTYERTFAANLNAALGRYSGSSHGFVDPYGVVEWSHVTIFKAYADTGSLQDVAVVKLVSPVGNKIGWLGARAPCAANYVPGLMPLTLGGYPLTAPVHYGGGTLTGSCFAATCMTRFDCNADLIMHTCDTSAGQSGGPLWDSLGYVRGVHIRGGADASAPYNLATTITKFILDQVMSW